MLDLQRVRKSPKTLTGLNETQFNRVRLLFSGTDSQFLTVAILCHLNTTHRVLAKLMGRLQPAVSRDASASRVDFATAYRNAIGDSPRMPISRLNSLDDVIREHPGIVDFFLNEADRKDRLIAA